MPSLLARDYKHIRIGRNRKQVRTGVWSMGIGKSLKVRSNNSGFPSAGLAIRTGLLLVSVACGGAAPTRP